MAAIGNNHKATGLGGLEDNAVSVNFEYQNMVHTTRGRFGDSEMMTKLAKLKKFQAPKRPFRKKSR